MGQALFQIYVRRLFTAKGREPLLVAALGGQAHADLSGGYRRFLEHDDVKDNERYRRDREGLPWFAPSGLQV
ncbi:MAG TPA: hypothetical protein VMT20_16530 [Terriglobia bacterium]|nr:hypothetical protein [Terriglobia bacterium]